MKNIQKVVLSALLIGSASAPAGAFSLIHHKQPTAVQTQSTEVAPAPAPHKKNFIQRHPVISAIGAAAVVHHFTKHRH